MVSANTFYMTVLSLGGSEKYGKNLQGFPRVVELPANLGLRRLVRTILLIKSLPNVPPHSLMIRDFFFINLQFNTSFSSCLLILLMLLLHTGLFYH